ncbi:aminoglycoside phosphotransferase family protein [Nocardia arizonensis]|uniref:aminoglycoside phosphotransferase family protein n=1 Tax=Nocardia arizonensis TaxID=1141647 RepID=UPI0006CF47E8|nr:aminoglycoside phosphotransferase family protein [Nocardia arizonensis]
MTAPPPIPERLEKAIIFLRGDQDGRAWLAALPERLTRYADRWKLDLDRVADSGAMSCCVYCATCEGKPAVLKVPVDEQSGTTEMLLLERWGPTGATPSILERDPDSGVYLMTRIEPGDIAWPIGSRVESQRFGELLSRLNRPALPELRELRDLADVTSMRMRWARERFVDPRYTEAMTRFGAPDRLAEAGQVLDTLLETTQTRFVLHADLQAKNILRGQVHWQTIDPLGAVGDPNAEAALWVAIQDGPVTIDDRLEQLAAHPLLDPIRLRAWTYVFAVVEYRPYLPPSGDRIEVFVRSAEPSHMIDLVCAR